MQTRLTESLTRSTHRIVVSFLGKGDGPNLFKLFLIANRKQENGKQPTMAAPVTAAYVEQVG